MDQRHIQANTERALVVMTLSTATLIAVFMLALSQI
jgi:hypothetical protein